VTRRNLALRALHFNNGALSRVKDVRRCGAAFCGAWGTVIDACRPGTTICRERHWTPPFAANGTGRLPSGSTGHLRFNLARLNPFAPASVGRVENGRRAIGAAHQCILVSGGDDVMQLDVFRPAQPCRDMSLFQLPATGVGRALVERNSEGAPDQGPNSCTSAIHSRFLLSAARVTPAQFIAPPQSQRDRVLA
jgi:hypothetical protein